MYKNNSHQIRNLKRNKIELQLEVTIIANV